MLFVLMLTDDSAMPMRESIGPYGASFRALTVAPSGEDSIYIIQHYPAEVAFRQPRCFTSTDAGDSWFEADADRVQDKILLAKP